MCMFFIFKYTPTDQVLVITDDYSVLSLFIYQKFLNEGWGYKNSKDDRCANVLMFSLIRNLTKCACLLLMQINHQQRMFGIYIV